MGHLEKRKPSPRKLPLEELEAYVSQHPDAFLREIAEHFNCSIPSVWAAFVAGQAGSKIIAPLLYHGTMTSELFMT